MSAAGIVLLSLLTFWLAIRVWLGARQIGHMRRHCELSARGTQNDVPDRVQAVAGQAIARAVLDVIAASAQVILIGALTLGGGLAWLDGHLPFRTASAAAIATEVVLLLLLVRIAAEAYQRFGIDGRIGLNRMTARSFAIDAAKRMAIAAALASVAGGALAWLIEMDRSNWWLWAALLLSIGLTAQAWFHPMIVAPLFARSPVLPDGLLRERLTVLLQRCGFSRIAIFVTDDSRRSARANARALGMAGACRIELSDTLVSLLVADEIEAVTAHEAGHLRLHHRAKDLAARILLGTTALAGFSALAGNSEVMRALGLSHETSAVSLAAFILMAPIFGSFLTPLASSWYRRLEYEADAFAARYIDPENLVRALRKLNAVNATTLPSDPVYVAFYSRHPEPQARLRRLMEYSRGGQP
jgi:STE24 endopeptidase